MKNGQVSFAWAWLLSTSGYAKCHQIFQWPLFRLLKRGIEHFCSFIGFEKALKTYQNVPLKIETSRLFFWVRVGVSPYLMGVKRSDLVSYWYQLWFKANKVLNYPSVIFTGWLHQIHALNLHCQNYKQNRVRLLLEPLSAHREYSNSERKESSMKVVQMVG